MCGIIGYVGQDDATSVILDGLKRLEYRGYDSAGVAVFTKSGVEIQRAEGKLRNLELALAKSPISGTCGIGHTRWATHGRPSEKNAHPHRAGSIVLVHNGIIENYADLKKTLDSDGREFHSETDTEVACHLVDHFLVKNGGDTLKALKSAVEKIRGSYAFVLINVNEPGSIFIAKRGSPLVVGSAGGSHFVASDIPALLPYTRDMFFLEDGDCGVLGKNGVQIFSASGDAVHRQINRIPWSPLMAEKGGYKHFMLKEIHEQTTVLQDVIAGRIDAVKSAVVLDELAVLFPGGKPSFDKISIVACGTSWHSALVGKYMIESLARMPVSVELASEFRYRDPILDKKTLVIPISQSGETADTLAATKMAEDLGSPVLSICNVVASSITRHSTASLYIHAGPEIGVASTKAFTAQLVALYLFAIYLGEKTGNLSRAKAGVHIESLLSIPRLVALGLKTANDVKAIAESISDCPNVLYIGRCLNFPVALEGALKLKEISYVHAEGFAAGELKHGPIALIDHGVPVIAIIPKDETYEKVLSNLEEVKARGAYVIAVATEGDASIAQKANEVVYIPQSCGFASPILATIPLQLLAYYVADHKGTDVDQPRNLAKSVTVE